MSNALPDMLLCHPLSNATAAVLRLAIAGDGGQRSDVLQEATDVLIDWMSDRANAKSFIPHPALIVRGLRAQGLDMPVLLRRRLEAAAMREEKRSSIAQEQANLLDDLLAREAIEHHPVRGWHFAKAYHPQPLARHSHAIRWLMPKSARQRMAELLAAQGWTQSQRAPLLSPHKTIFTGPARISVELHSRPFGWTRQVPDASTLRGPEFTALEMIGAALVEPQAKAGLWTVDLVQLLRKDMLDPRLFAELARHFGLADSSAKALAAVIALTVTSDARVHDDLGRLAHALTGRDARIVRDLIRVQMMAVTPRRHLLISGAARPDLLVRSQILRRDQQRRMRHSAEERQRLRQQQSANRG